eukprot:6457375-Amphidinium_carterae.1
MAASSDSFTALFADTETPGPGSVDSLQCGICGKTPEVRDGRIQLTSLPRGPHRNKFYKYPSNLILALSIVLSCLFLPSVSKQQFFNI